MTSDGKTVFCKANIVLRFNVIKQNNLVLRHKVVFFFQQ